VFEGGFLGMDNVGPFDRSHQPPGLGRLEQSDGTAWTAMLCLDLMQIALRLALRDRAYEDVATKFFEHFAYISQAIVDEGLWDDEDGFFYDLLHTPDDQRVPLRVRSMVGLLPFCAVTVFEGGLTRLHPELIPRMHRFIESRQELKAFIHDPEKPGHAGRKLGAILDETRLRRVLARMLDEAEFLSPHGIRSLSRVHEEHPYVFRSGPQEYRVSYLPAESDSGMFGGNSNWRGPVWMPVNVLIVRALLQYYAYYGNDFTVECPTGSGQRMNLYQVAQDIIRRLSEIFLRDANGRRPVYGGTQTFQEDPHWRDLLQFFEYFHGDNGAGLGASHQTGWTGVIAALMRLSTRTAEESLETPKGVTAAVPVGARPAKTR